EVAHVTPTFRIGSWLNGLGNLHWRPYLEAGAGWYEILEKANFKFEGNQFLFRFQFEEQTNDYLGAHAGGGLEFEVYPQGVVGVQFAYHRVFSRPQNLQFFSPGLRFSYIF